MKKCLVLLFKNLRAENVVTLAGIHVLFLAVYSEMGDIETSSDIWKKYTTLSIPTDVLLS